MDLYCDVDGTLIDKDDNIRPFVKELFETAFRKGHCIFIWSAGGVSYAKIQIQRIYHKLGMSTPATIIPKDFKLVRFKDHRSVCIDDMEDVCISFFKWKGYGYKVPYYESLLMKDDHSLKDIAEHL